jgi:hypothetical protein
MRLENNFDDLIVYDKEIEVKNLDELVDYLDKFSISQNFQTQFIHLNSPINLTYIDSESYSPICDKHLLLNDKNLIKEIARYHLTEKLDFYCGIRHENDPDSSELQMFGNYLIQHQYNLFQGSTIEIKEPKIIMSSQNGIAFPTIYDETTFTSKNIEFDNRIFGNLKKEQKISKLN